MTREGYEQLFSHFRGRPRRLTALKWANLFSTGICYVCYPLLLAALLLLRDGRFLRCLLVPLIGVVLLSLFRDRVNAPRPYEALGFTPLLHKETKGHSFPSRHVYCAFLIACTFLYVLPWMGVFLLLTGMMLALVRVISGVHFPKDVIVGGVLGLATGLIGYVLIP